MNDRYHSDFGRQDRFHDFDHRDRGRYQDHSLDRLVLALLCCLQSEGRDGWSVTFCCLFFTGCFFCTSFFEHDVVGCGVSLVKLKRTVLCHELSIC